MVSRLLSTWRRCAWALVATAVVLASSSRGQSPGDVEELDQPSPLAQAHAHNDYYHRRPLLDALARGFSSVEADVFLVDGQLLVGHDRGELKPERTLEALYLAPLAAVVERNGGHVYPEGGRFTLLIDFKTEGPATFRALRQELKNYRKLCTSIDHGKQTQRAVDMVVSGNRPFEEVASHAERRVMLDGRIDEQTADVPVELVPLVSDRWTRFFRWRGEGEMPNAERQRLHELVDNVHEQGRRIRFWATPDNPQVWDVLLEAGVDVIGVDDLDRLAEYLRKQQTTR